MGLEARPLVYIEPSSISDVPVDVKRSLLNQEIQMWRNTRYQYEVRQRVQKRIENTEGEAAAIKALEECEKALDALQEELNAL